MHVFVRLLISGVNWKVKISFLSGGKSKKKVYDPAIVIFGGAVAHKVGGQMEAREVDCLWRIHEHIAGNST